MFTLEQVVAIINTTLAQKELDIKNRMVHAALKPDSPDEMLRGMALGIQEIYSFGATLELNLSREDTE
jgi:hypothetical protein